VELIVGMKEMPELTVHSLVLSVVQHDFTAQLAHLVMALQNTADVTVICVLAETFSNPLAPSGEVLDDDRYMMGFLC